MELPRALRALAHRNYRLFFAGQLISLIGTWMQSVGEMWLVYRLSHSSLLLGTAGFFSQIPVFLLAPFGGMLADTRDRRRILVATQTSAMILAGILAALTLTGVVRVWHVFTLAAMLGVVNAVDIPTRQAFVADLRRPDLSCRRAWPGYLNGILGWRRAARRHHTRLQEAGEGARDLGGSFRRNVRDRSDGVLILAALLAIVCAHRVQRLRDDGA